MTTTTRRSVLAHSLAVTAAGTLARPFIAHAAAKTATVWWMQGFVEPEDIAFKKIVADYEKASGNKIDYTIGPFAPMRQKIVAAVTSGVVPDIFQNTPAEVGALWAWEDKLEDLSDVIETQKHGLAETAVLSVYCYNNAKKERSYYGAPYGTGALPCQVRRSWITKTGYKIEDIPKTWDAYWDFFKEVQKKLRAQGDRHAYGLGFQVTTNGNDPNNVFGYFTIAYGGKDLVTKDGKLHLDDPKIKEAVTHALAYPATAYKEGFVPPAAINWNDADDNNAFHAKQIVAYLDGTLSNVLALRNKPDEYKDVLIQGLPLSNDGKPTPTQVIYLSGLVPKGAKNVAVAKEFLKYLIQPQVNNEFWKVANCRYAPVYPSLVKEDPYWLDPKDPHRPAYVRQCLIDPTVPDWFVYNPAWAYVRNEHLFPVGWADIMKGGMTPEAAADKAFKRVAQIFAKYPLV
jgi:multiple sugar transport system substrate-binding protein